MSEDLRMNVSARWLPRMLTEEQKKMHVDVCTDLFSRLQAEPRELHEALKSKRRGKLRHGVIYKLFGGYL